MGKHCKPISLSDAEIAKNNRLPELMQMHEQWKAKKQEDVEMPGVISMGQCASCGEKPVRVSENFGAKRCSSCKAVYSNVNKRLPVVIDAIKTMGKAEEVVSSLGVNEVAKVNVESDLLNRLGKMVGYDGDNGEELFGLINSKIQNADDLAEATRERDKFMIELRDVLGVKAGPLEDLIKAVASKKNMIEQSADFSCICRMLLIPEDTPMDEVENAVCAIMTSFLAMRTQADYNMAEAKRNLRRADRLAAESTSLAERIRELETASTLESVTGSITSIDTPLLDIALDTLKGKITGLGPERIEALRAVGA